MNQCVSQCVSQCVNQSETMYEFCETPRNLLVGELPKTHCISGKSAPTDRGGIPVVNGILSVYWLPSYAFHLSTK